MTTCASCKHWQMVKDRYSSIILPYKPGAGYEPCQTEAEAQAQRGYRVRYCMSPSIVFYQEPPRNGATICDGSEYKGELLTAEDFGCVLHEPDQQKG